MTDDSSATQGDTAGSIAWTDPLAEWLAPRLGAGSVSITDVGKPSSGFSAETMLFTASTSSGDRRLVLRKETPDPPVYPTQVPGLTVEVEIQYRTMEALSKAADIPLAPLIGYEGDAEVLGTPFFVMGAVIGDVPIESPPYTKEGFFLDAAPDQRRRMIAGGLDVLARVHAVDWRDAGMDWLLPAGEQPTAARQLRIWEDYAYRELDGRPHPLIDRARDWLHENLPSGSMPGVCWGDPRPGNIIWQDFRPACVTDFEAVSIAPPEVDAGWWLFFDRTMHETEGVDRLDGDPSRDEQREIYAAAAGRDIGDLLPFEVLSGFRYAAIVVRVMNRLVARGQLRADNTLWLDNPPSQTLAAVLEEAGA